MPLPSIPAYELPTVAELPTNRVDWQLDPRRTAVLVHDLQNYFVDAFPERQQPMDGLLGNVAQVLSWARDLQVPIAYSAQPGGQTEQQRGLQQDFWGSGLPRSARAEAIVADVAPEPGDTMITKWKYSAFVRTDFEQWLRAQGRDQLLIVGVYAHIGVLMTAADAWMRDIQAFVVADAVGDFSAADHRMALSWAASRCAVVTHTQAVLTTSPALAPIGGGR